MKQLRIFCAAAALMIVIPAYPGTTLFGVPFGDPLPYKPGRCPARPPIEKVCYISPEASKNSGGGKLPTKGLPAWAEYSSPDIRIGKKNEINRIDFSTWDRNEIHPDVVESISKRFGKPGRLDTGSAVNYEWAGEGVHIRYFCARQICTLTFMSDAALQELAKDQEALKAKRQAMPTSP